MMLCERLLFSAMIEARSWTIQSAIWKHQGYGISKIYRDLMISEAGHYTTFLSFARKYADNVDVDKRWKRMDNVRNINDTKLW
jgi:tRNA-(ms[2]io[6]A)-hydroxylase